MKNVKDHPELQDFGASTVLDKVERIILQSQATGRTDAEQLLAGGRECDVHGAATPSANAVFDLGDLVVIGAGVAKQLDERGL